MSSSFSEVCSKCSSVNDVDDCINLAIEFVLADVIWGLLLMSSVVSVRFFVSPSQIYWIPLSVMLHLDKYNIFSTLLVQKKWDKCIVSSSVTVMSYNHNISSEKLLERASNNCFILARGQQWSCSHFKFVLVVKKSENANKQLLSSLVCHIRSPLTAHLLRFLIIMKALSVFDV